jgi:hypothetical protein
LACYRKARDDQVRPGKKNRRANRAANAVAANASGVANTTVAANTSGVANITVAANTTNVANATDAADAM